MMIIPMARILGMFEKQLYLSLLLHSLQIFIGIQEGLIHQVEFLDSKMNDYKYVGVGRDDANRKGEYCAIFFNEKKYKLLKNSTFWLSENPNEVSIGWDAALERICTYALLETIKVEIKFGYLILILTMLEILQEKIC